MADHDRPNWEAPADGDFARYVERLSAGATRPVVPAPPPGLQPQPRASHQRLPGGGGEPGRVATSALFARRPQLPQVPLAALLAQVRRLLLVGGFVAMALSPVLGLRLWPLTVLAGLLWVALGWLAARLAAEQGRARRAGQAGAPGKTTRPRQPPRP